MYQKRIILIFTLLFNAYNLFAQTSESYFQIAGDYFDKGDYKNAIIYYEKSLLVDKNTYGPNHIYIGNDYWLIGFCYSRLGEYNKAISSFEKALEIFESPKIKSDKSKSETKIDAAKFTSDTFLELGIAYEALGKYKNALQYYQKQLSINIKTYGEKHIKTSNAYRNVGYMSLACGDNKESIQSFNKATEIIKFLLGENSLEYAENILDLAQFYISLGNYTEAITNLKRAEEIYNLLLEPTNIEFAYLYQWFSEYYRRTLNINQALDYGYKAIDIFDVYYGENNFASIAAYGLIEKCYALLGDESRTLAVLLKCKNYYEKYPHQNLIDILSSISDIYTNKKDYANALFYCEEAIKVCKQYWGETTLKITSLTQKMGSIYHLRKDFKKALDFYLKALAYYTELEEDDTEIAISLMISIASTYHDLDKYEKAEYYYIEAYKKSNELGYISSEATACHGLGVLYRDPNYQDLKNSVKFSKKWLQLSKDSVFYKSAISSAISEFYITAGWGIYSNEIDFFRELISHISYTTERACLDMQSLKTDLLKESLPIYYYGVGLETKNKNPEKAFEYSEMLRSRGFLDQVGLDRALSLDGITNDEKDQVQKLTTQILKAREEIETQMSLDFKERDTKKMVEIENILQSAEKSLAKLDASISKRLPTYLQLKNPKVVSAKDVKKWCGKDKAILEYVIWNSSILEHSEKLKNPNLRKCADDIQFCSYCLVVTNKEVIAIKLDDTYDYSKAITELRNSVIPKSIRPIPEVVFEKTRNELYEKLIEPVLPFIKGKKEIIIVPDGSLSFLPFDILRKDESSKMLCQQYEISLSPSISVSMLADSKKNKGEQMLAFGAAWYDAKISEEEHRRTFSGTRTINRGLQVSSQFEKSNDLALALLNQEITPSEYFEKKNFRWSDLPGTLTELEAVKKLTTNKKYAEYLQESCSENTLKKLSKDGTLAKYPILHFACHGFFDKDIPNMSSILFSEVSGKIINSSEDGYLTIPEVATLNLDADMICLSACETGLGEIHYGDGMTGFSRAFMVAGSRNVGVTLWCVDDEATSEFMSTMYKKVLKQGKDYMQAYKETKNEFIKSEEYSHPYYWAGFVLYN